MENDVISFVKKFEEAEAAAWDERLRNERDRDYYDGKQLSDAERNALRERGQPPVIYNRIRRKVNFMLGLERQSRRDPKAFPRNPQDQDAAQAVTDALRYVAEDEDWDAARSDAWENMLVEGTGAILVGFRPDKMGFTPSLVHIPWDRFFYDPHSRRHDFSDAQYMGIVTWYDVEQAKQMWPDAEEVISATYEKGQFSDTYDDRPKYKVWSDRRRDRVRIIEIFCRTQDGWETAIFTQLGFIKEPVLSPYADEMGRPDNPIVATSLYIDRENNRYGDIRDSIDPQDEINKRRSKGLHLISMRQIKMPPNSTMGPEQARKEAARPDGVFTDDIEILNTNDMAAQNIQLLQESKQEIDLQGANAALQGKNENDMSGRAILAQQQGGMVEVALHMDRLRHLTLKVYRAMWSRIRQSWTGERWVRVTDDERNLRFVGINQPVTAGQLLMEQIEASPALMQRLQADPMAQQRLAIFMASPQSNQVAEIRNVPAEIDVDIVIDEGMDTPTIAAEQWSELAKLASTGVVPIPPDVLIEASQLRDKEKLLERLEQPPEDNGQQMIAQEAAVSEIEKTKSETAKNYAEAERDNAETVQKAFEAGLAG